jgi:hypothetical protein
MVSKAEYLWHCREDSTITHWKCVSSSNQNKHNKDECSHDLVSVTHEVLDHHLHREWQWLLQLLHTDFISGQWVYIIVLKFQAKFYTKICVLSFCHICKSNGKTQSWFWPTLKRRQGKPQSGHWHYNLCQTSIRFPLRTTVPKDWACSKFVAIRPKIQIGQGNTEQEPDR